MTTRFGAVCLQLGPRRRRRYEAGGQGAPRLLLPDGRLGRARVRPAAAARWL